jgi:pyruvate dehydrogenase E1 component beta subunit
MYLTLDQVINHCASWNYMFDGKVNVPIVIRGIVNRGGEQGAQHSQSPLAIYANIPGLKVVCPATAYDAKGLLLAAISDPNPVIYIDDRWLYDMSSMVPEEYYEVSIGKANILRKGSQVTIVAASYMVKESLEAARALEAEGISCEVIDLRTIKPIDFDKIIDSVNKTGRLVVAIEEWKTASVSATVANGVYEKCFDKLLSPIKTVNLPDAPAPASKVLEEAYYVRSKDIAATVRSLLY